MFCGTQGSHNDMLNACIRKCLVFKRPINVGMGTDILCVRFFDNSTNVYIAFVRILLKGGMLLSMQIILWGMAEDILT